MTRSLVLVFLVASCGASAPSSQTTPPGPPASEPEPPAVEEVVELDPVDFEVDLAVLRLTMEDPELRMEGARTLLALGPRSRPAMVNLYDCLRDEDVLEIAEVCADAMAAIGEVSRTYLENNPVLEGERALFAAAALEGLDARASR